MLAVMLLASLSVSGALSVSAEDKTGDGLAAYAMTAYNEGWRYVWGGASYGAVDCSGLIYSYVGGGARVTEDMLYSSPESGYVSAGVPDIPGLGLWQPGHVGVYVGGGMAVDARDEISNVCYQSVSTKSWVMWFKVNGVSYGTDTGVTNDDQSNKTATDNEKKSEAEKKTESKPEATLSLGSTGSEVNALQERLKTLGYFNDDTTEYFGYVTKGALEDFQREAGLSVTGIYDAATKKALEAADAVKKPKAEEEKPEADEPEILYDTEEDAAEIPAQAEPDDEAKPDGEEPDNDEQTGDQNAESDLDAAASEPEEDSDGTEGIFAQFDEYDSDEQSSANGSEVEDLPKEADDAVYSLGDESAEISDIQYILIKLGYFDYNITGEYCENTAQAVEQFREDHDLGEGDYLNEETLDAIYGVWDGTYSVTVAKAPLYESISAAEDEQAAQPDQADDPESTASSDTKESEQPGDSDAPSEQSVTFTVADTDTDSDTSAASATGEKPFADTAKADTEQTASAPSAASVKSPQTSDKSENVVFVQTGVEDYVSKTMILIVIGATCIVIFFAGTIHYWNVSMEKRRRRARRATTVSVYHRSIM